MTDRHSKEQRSRNMQAVKSKVSKIEQLLRKELWRRGYRYRKNYKRVEGIPDVVFTKYKIAIFCDSEFWHGKEWEHRKYEIQSHRDFWWTKIEANVVRDKNVNTKLEEKGWIVLRFWGEDINHNLGKCLKIGRAHV
jgi:DNA mismatch endonuclease Vsr